MGRNKPIAFLFPGQASQFAGLGKSLYEKFSLAREIFFQATRILEFNIAELCFYGSEEDLSLTENAQPVILTVSIAAWNIFRESKRGYQIIGLAGHSLGEYSALVAAGAISFADALRIVRLRGQAMQKEADEAGETMMAAVMGLSFKRIVELCQKPIKGEIISPANFNSPRQVVISGHKNSVLTACKKAKQLGGRCVPLKVSAPFHCAIMEPVKSVLADYFKKVKFKDPLIPVVRNTDALVYQAAWEIPQILIDQIVSPVLWSQSVNRLIQMGAREFYVPCPSRVIAGLVKQIDQKIPVFGLDDFDSIQRAFKALDK